MTTDFGNTKEWYDDEAAFAAQLARGRRNELRVAMMLLPLGVSVRMGALQERHGLASQDPTLNEQTDLDIDDGRHLIEVKGRGFAFTGMHDYPFPTAYTIAVDKWERRKRKPCVTVVLSEPSDGIFVVPTSTFRLWTVEDFFDSVRKKYGRSYAAPRETWKGWDALIDHITLRDCSHHDHRPQPAGPDHAAPKPPSQAGAVPV